MFPVAMQRLVRGSDAQSTSTGMENLFTYSSIFIHDILFFRLFVIVFQAWVWRALLSTGMIHESPSDEKYLSFYLLVICKKIQKLLLELRFLIMSRIG